MNKMRATFGVHRELCSPQVGEVQVSLPKLGVGDVISDELLFKYFISHY